jgi:hypothetical protein
MSGVGTHAPTATCSTATGTSCTLTATACWPCTTTPKLALDVLRLDGDQVAEVDYFLTAELLKALGRRQQLRGCRGLPALRAAHSARIEGCIVDR